MSEHWVVHAAEQLLAAAVRGKDNNNNNNNYKKSPKRFDFARRHRVPQWMFSEKKKTAADHANPHENHFLVYLEPGEAPCPVVIYMYT